MLCVEYCIEYIRRKRMVPINAHLGAQRPDLRYEGRDGLLIARNQRCMGHQVSYQRLPRVPGGQFPANTHALPPGCSRKARLTTAVH